MKKKIEILAPVGDFPSLRAAIQARADGIYFGIEHLNMRAHSTNNFLTSDLEKIATLCRKHNIKSHITLNTIIYDEDLEKAKQICHEAKKHRIDGIIASDFALIQYAHSMGLNVHISTQANVCNVESVKFFSKYATTIVLSRELTLRQITFICRAIEADNICGPTGELVKIEIFIHGALCVAISGKCYMSLVQYNRSANRGECLQACRRKYRVIEEETQKELIVDNQYVMSPKDLCTISILDRILNSGAAILKIEGRARPAEYVDTVVTIYREGIQAIKNNTYTEKKINQWIKRLKTVFNRGFWHGGYYLGEEIDQWSKTYGSKSTKKKRYVGKITNYFSKSGVAEALIQSHQLKIGDEFLVIGEKSGVIRGVITNLRHEKHCGIAEKGERISFPLKEKIRKNDKLYILENT